MPWCGGTGRSPERSRTALITEPGTSFMARSISLSDHPGTTTAFLLNIPLTAARAVRAGSFITRYLTAFSTGTVE